MGKGRTTFYAAWLIAGALLCFVRTPLANASGHDASGLERVIADQRLTPALAKLLQEANSKTSGPRILEETFLRALGKFMDAQSSSEREDAARGLQKMFENTTLEKSGDDLVAAFGLDEQKDSTRIDALREVFDKGKQAEKLSPPRMEKENEEKLGQTPVRDKGKGPGNPGDQKQPDQLQQQPFPQDGPPFDGQFPQGFNDNNRPSVQPGGSSGGSPGGGGGSPQGGGQPPSPGGGSGGGGKGPGQPPNIPPPSQIPPVGQLVLPNPGQDVNLLPLIAEVIKSFGSSGESTNALIQALAAQQAKMFEQVLQPRPNPYMLMRPPPSDQAMSAGLNGATNQRRQQLSGKGTPTLR